MHSSGMLTARSSNRLEGGGVAASVHAGIHPPRCGPGDPLGVGLEPPRCRPGDTPLPWVQPGDTPSSWVWAWRSPGCGPGDTPLKQTLPSGGKYFKMTRVKVTSCYGY